MTKEEFIEKIKGELKEELEGIVKYDEMYKAAKDIGLTDEADVIEYIAGEEYSHACTLKKMLRAHGVTVREAGLKALWDRVESIFDE